MANDGLKNSVQSIKPSGSAQQGNSHDLGKRLKQERLAKGLTQETVSGLCGISRQAWSAYENSKAVPTLPHLITIAKCLEKPLEELLE